ncbi:MAG: AAA family ATPase [Jannaschia sp.]
MASNLATIPETEPLRAVTVSRDVQEFDLLIEDMEAELGEGWGDLDFIEAVSFLRQDEARTLEFIVIAVDQEDETNLSQVLEVTRLAKRAGLQVILVAEGLSPMSLHELLRAGADDFAPYPLPENALSDAVSRIRSPGGPEGQDVLKRAGAELVESTAVAEPKSPTGGGSAPKTEGALFALQSAAGGDGATTIAVNLAWEMAHVTKENPPSVCIIDLGLQFGSVATYLDLHRKSTIFEVLSDIVSMDEQAFKQSLSIYKDKLHVFTAPADVLPLDVVGPDEIAGLIRLARASFDVVIIDMPATVTSWTETVLRQSDIFFVCCELEIRSAQNALRFQNLLRSEQIPTDHLGYLLNKAPGKMDMGGRGRIDKLANSLEVKFHAVLPDGGKQVTEVNDQAAPLRELAARNALTKEIAKLALGLHNIREQVESKGAAKPAAKKKAIFGLKFG